MIAYFIFTKKRLLIVGEILLAFTAGIMMAAVMMGLIPEALKNGGVIEVSIGLLLGVLILTMLKSNSSYRLGAYEEWN